MVLLTQVVTETLEACGDDDATDVAKSGETSCAFCAPTDARFTLLLLSLSSSSSLSLSLSLSLCEYTYMYGSVFCAQLHVRRL
jgi:hypothetical protein